MKNGSYLNENRKSKNEMLCAADDYNDTCYICAKGFLDSNFSLAVINKISNFHESAQISHIHKNRNFKHIGDWWINCFLAYHIILWQWHVRNVLFHFCQLWAVKITNLIALHWNKPKTNVFFINVVQKYLKKWACVIKKQQFAV